MSIPRLEPYPGAPAPWRKRTYRLAAPWSPFPGLIVPGSFLFDGASIPRFVQFLTLGRFPTPFEPVLMRAALAHDWLYWTKQYPRKKADYILRKLCLEDGMKPAVANTIHRAVRAFGGSYWKNNADDFFFMSEFVRHPSNAGYDPEDFGLPEEALELL